VTIDYGTNVLVGSDPEKIMAAFERVHRNNDVVKGQPPHWDGHAADRIIKVLADDFVLSDTSPQRR
jgi:UDP-N-acetylglucosamine 2-epimerase (non-hydrolysing)